MAVAENLYIVLRRHSALLMSRGWSVLHYTFPENSSTSASNFSSRSQAMILRTMLWLVLCITW
jgi:hypothetical protein